MKPYQTYYDQKYYTGYPQQRVIPNANFPTKQIRPSSSNPYLSLNSSSQPTKMQSASPNNKTPPESRVLHDKFISPYDQSRIDSLSTKQLGPSSITQSKGTELSIHFLPEKSKKNSNKKTLILDLDETLVHSSFKPFPFKPDICLRIAVDNKEHIVNVLKRPYVEEFLLRMAKCFELVIFTASVSPYANPLLDKLDNHKVISHRLFREHCINVSGLYIKDLSKVGRNLKDTIILDNNPISYVVNKENGLPILTWNFDRNDTELVKIIPFLEYLSKVNDVRPIIKATVVNNMINVKDIINDINIINSTTKSQRASSSSHSKGSESKEKKHRHSSQNQKNQSFTTSSENKKSININIVNHHVSNVFLKDYQQQEEGRSPLINKKKNFNMKNNMAMTVSQKDQPSFNSSCVLKPKYANEKETNYLLKSSNKASEPVSLVESNTRNNLSRSNTNYYDNLNQMPSRSSSYAAQKVFSNNHNNMVNPYIVKDRPTNTSSYYNSNRQSIEMNRDYSSRYSSNHLNQFNYRPKSSLSKNNYSRDDYIDNPNIINSNPLSHYQYYSRERDIREPPSSSSIYQMHQPVYYLQERENNLRFGSRTIIDNDPIIINGMHYDSPYRIDNNSQMIARNFSSSSRDRFYPGVNSVIFKS